MLYDNLNTYRCVVKLHVIVSKKTESGEQDPDTFKRSIVNARKASICDLGTLHMWASTNTVLSEDY